MLSQPSPDLKAKLLQIEEQLQLAMQEFPERIAVDRLKFALALAKFVRHQLDLDAHALLSPVWGSFRQIVCLTAAVAGSPVLGVPWGSISRRWTSSSATGRCSTPFGTTWSSPGASLTSPSLS